MSAKETIIEAIRKNLPKEKIDYPNIPTYEKSGVNLLDAFKKNLEIAAGEWHEVQSVAEAQKIMAGKLPDASIIGSATTEWTGNKPFDADTTPQALNDVDLGIFRAEFGVAEMGMVWITEKDLVVNAIGFLSQHLAVLLDPDRITENMHTAYKLVAQQQFHYGNFMMGPSATADIGAYLVHGAQGARSLTVFLLKKQD